ncbi:unnamed protein product [Ixodes hexagonus]
MKTVLTCALLLISYVVVRSSSDEGARSTTENPYEANYRNNSGLCGAWYRNESILEELYNCTLNASIPLVNSTWETTRKNLNESIPQFVGQMCNFVSRHQLSEQRA